MKLAINGSNRKGSLMVPLVIFGAIITLIGLLTLVFIKGASFEKSLGDRQLELFMVYQVGEKYLHFVDESAKLSIGPALLEISRNGLKKIPDPNCGKDTSQQYTLWAKDSTGSDCNIVPKTCYPSENEEESYFKDSFKSEYLPLLQEFNDKKSGFTDFTANVPNEFSKLDVKAAGNNLELVGTAKDPISIERVEAKAPYNPVLKYKVKPSFRVGIDANFLNEGAEIAGKAPQLLRKKAADISSALASFNSQNPGLKWNLESYSAPQTTCSHVIGKCSYCCSYGRDAEGNSYCTGTCERDNIETVYYNNVYAAFSVANGKSFYVSEPPSTQPQLKNVAYNFGLNWLEETGRTTTC